MSGNLAAKRSQNQLAPIGLFVESLYALGGYATWKEFADDSGVSQGQISEFKNAVVEPSGLNMLRLIRAAATRGEGESDEIAAAVRALPPDPLSVLAGVVAEIAETQKAILARLPAQPAARELAPPTDPKQKSAPS